MARSVDQTLLSKLGFADPDKKDPEHDLASRFLAQKGLILKLLGPKLPKEEQFSVTQDHFNQKYECHGIQHFQFSVDKLNVEFHLMKGAGQYATTVGFVDVMAHWSLMGWQEGMRRHRLEDDSWSPWQEYRTDLHRSITLRREGEDHILDRKGSLVIEVKINRCPTHDIIRQIKLYRSYAPAQCLAFAATAFDLTASELETLNAEGIKHIRLGTTFEKWKAEQAAKSPAVGDENFLF